MNYRLSSYRDGRSYGGGGGYRGNEITARRRLVRAHTAPRRGATDHAQRGSIAAFARCYYFLDRFIGDRVAGSDAHADLSDH